MLSFESLEILFLGLLDGIGMPDLTIFQLVLCLSSDLVALALDFLLDLSAGSLHSLGDDTTLPQSVFRFILA